MKQPRIRILREHYKELAGLSDIPSGEEAVAFMVARWMDTVDGEVLISTQVMKARAHDYLEQGPYHLSVSPLYVSRLITLAENASGTVVMVHSHPFEGGRPRYSPSDDFGEARTSESISKNLNGSPPVGSILVGKQYLSARIWSGRPEKSAPASAAVLGPGSLFLHGSFKPGSIPKLLLDRQIRYLGEEVQSTLEDLHVGVVGLGGTGSAITEQLARMGVSRFTLVDPDTFEPSNWSRVYGSAWGHQKRGEAKVDIAMRNVRRISQRARCRPLPVSVLSRAVLEELASCDFIFSCVDRHGPRAVINELSYQCYVPVVDLGVGLGPALSGDRGGSVRATIIGPGMPCLFCQEIVRPELIMAENLSPEDYARRRAREYVPEILDAAPSVIAFTTLASAFGIILFLDALSPAGHAEFSSLLFDVRTQRTHRLVAQQKRDCVCSKRLGMAFLAPFSVAD
jgi:hypothetical protein